MYNNITQYKVTFLDKIKLFFAKNRFSYEIEGNKIVETRFKIVNGIFFILSAKDYEKC